MTQEKMSEHPRRFHAYIQHVKGRDVLSMPSSELDAAMSDTDANPIPVDITKTSLGAVAHDAAVIACVAERDSEAVRELRVYRDDPKDAPTPVNEDAYEVWQGLPDSMDVEGLVVTCDTDATPSQIREHYSNYAMFVKKPHGPNHWQSALPDSVAVRFTKSDEYA
jgi:hypothetical protein